MRWVFKEHRPNSNWCFIKASLQSSGAIAAHNKGGF